MFRHLLLLSILVIGICPIVLGQQGQVVDQSTQTPLMEATIYALANQKGTTTDQNGQFSLTLSSYPDTLIVSYVGYVEQMIPLTEATDWLRIAMVPQSKLLPEVVVRAYQEAERLVPARVSVLDYEVMADGILVLAHTQNRYHLQWLNKNGTVVAQQRLPRSRPQQLFRSCLGGLYLFYPTYLRQVEIQSSEIIWGDSIARSVYRQLFRPCKATDDTTLYTAYHRYSGQVWQLFAVSRGGTGGRMIHEIVDEEQLVRLADEEKLLRDKAIGLSPRKAARMVELEKIFARQVIYQPIAIDVFMAEEELVLFDYANSQINWLSPDGELSRSYPIAFHQGKRWEEVVVQDPIQQKFYTFFRDNQYTYVFEVDPDSGLLEEKAALPEIYLKRLEVYDGELYYLHRGITFDDRQKYLYHLSLPN